MLIVCVFSVPEISSVGMVNGFLVLSYEFKSQPYLVIFVCFKLFFLTCFNSSIFLNKRVIVNVAI